jgi:serine/threonine-protein kinase
VIGKWNRRRYVVERLIGEGANGRVYLVRGGRGIFAMKVASGSLDLQAEINALLALQSDGGMDPYLLDADDAHVEGSDPVSFYIMKYIQGTNIMDYLARSGPDWFELVARRLLERLRDLHAKGFIFGDLKRDNIIVSGHGRVDLVDYGGVTRKGMAVRQFTELYDRGYWNAGGRKADEAYDLFAFAVVCIQCTDPLRELDFTGGVLPQNRSPAYLKEILSRCGMKPKIKELVRGMIDGKTESADRALEQWRSAMLAPAGTANSAVPGWMKGALVASAMVLFAALLWTFW